MGQKEVVSLKHQKNKQQKNVYHISFELINNENEVLPTTSNWFLWLSSLISVIKI